MKSSPIISSTLASSLKIQNWIYQILLPFSAKESPCQLSRPSTETQKIQPTSYPTFTRKSAPLAVWRNGPRPSLLLLKRISKERSQKWSRISSRNLPTAAQRKKWEIAIKLWLLTLIPKDSLRKATGSEAREKWVSMKIAAQMTIFGRCWEILGNLKKAPTDRSQRWTLNDWIQLDFTFLFSRNS